MVTTLNLFFLFYFFVSLLFTIPLCYYELWYCCLCHEGGLQICAHRFGVVVAVCLYLVLLFLLQINFDIISFFGRFLGVNKALSEGGNFVVAPVREVSGYINIFMCCLQEPQIDDMCIFMCYCLYECYEHIYQQSLPHNL